MEEGTGVEVDGSEVGCVTAKREKHWDLFTLLWAYVHSYNVHVTYNVHVKYNVHVTYNVHIIYNVLVTTCYM